ncbi:MAG TPA: SulP family inorganic anion transporter [Actinomycetota bacterium]|nr:SulP family inorganic anion transporter [Actinomycetota bacterium]
MSDQRRSVGILAALASGVVIGAVEVVLAISFAALVFGGYLASFLSQGIGLYLVASAATLAILAWRAGARGVVGSVQDAAAAVLAVIATTTALDAFGSLDRAFLTVVAATVVVTVTTGIVFALLGAFRLGNLVRYVPYPVVGGFLAGTGWLLFKGGIGVAASVQPYLRTIGDLLRREDLMRWIPALAFGVLLLVVSRMVKRPLVIPAVIGLGLVLFAAGVLVTGSSLDEVRDGLWLLGPFPTGEIWEPRTVLDALTDADWSAVLGQVAGIATAVFVAVIAALFNVSGIELIRHTDLDSNRELRDAGVVNVVSGAFGGIPGYHALSLTALAYQMGVNARVAGLVAALVPLTAVVFGASMIELIPRMIVGGALVFVGLGFIVDWVWDKRRSLPLSEYLVVLAILAVIITRGLLPGVAAGLVLAVVLFAVNYSRLEQVREEVLGDTYRSNVDRPPGERDALRALGERVQILRVEGFVFFGTSSGLLERVRKRVEAGDLRYLVIDLRRVTGMDSSAAMSFRKIAQLAEANAFELVLTDVPQAVRGRLERGGVVTIDGVVRFEPDLDRGLERCEDGLLGRVGTGVGRSGALAGLPERLWDRFEQRDLPEGAVLITQGASPDDVWVLESGRLRIEMRSAHGTQVRLSTVLPGVMVGEIALYTGAPRTADVVAETPSVVLRLGRDEIERLEAEEPALAVSLHRWFATTLAHRLTDRMRAFDALLD